MAKDYSGRSIVYIIYEKGENIVLSRKDSTLSLLNIME